MVTVTVRTVICISLSFRSHFLPTNIVNGSLPEAATVRNKCNFGLFWGYKVTSLSYTASILFLK